MNPFDELGDQPAGAPEQSASSQPAASGQPAAQQPEGKAKSKSGPKVKRPVNAVGNGPPATIRDGKWWAMRIASGLFVIGLAVVVVKGKTWFGERPVAKQQKTGPKKKPPRLPQSLIVPNAKIKDAQGKVIPHETVDLGPTVEGAKRGGAQELPLEGPMLKLFPPQSPGYWKLYIHPTASLPPPGPQRVVLGQRGEVYYSQEYGKGFVKVRDAIK